MSLTPSTIPPDLSGLTGVPPEEVYPLLERAAREQEPAALDSLTALLLDRALRLLRQGSRQEIFEEAKALNRVLAGTECASLEETTPRIHGGWTALGELLSEASRRSDRAAVDSILLSTKGHGQSLLEELAREGRPLPRAEIRKRLRLGESHLSHLLRDLAEANLIVRYRPEGSKEVLLDLGPVGREVVKTSILPDWLHRLVEFLGKAASGEPVGQETAARELETAGAPSRIAAERLAEALAALSGGPATEEPRPGTPETLAKVLHFSDRMASVKNDENHFDLMRDRQGDQRPGALFEIEENAVQAR
ncbi:MAG TPA: winged helix DNA-binding protein [Thermoanaerobaculia bacterium]|nr:winged helix DNA-binding protein [Thermoanaerobaculia bacterium]